VATSTPQKFKTTIYPDGRIALDVPPDGDLSPGMLSLMTNMAGADAPIAVAPCLPPEQVEGIAQRLAALFLGVA
jgi:hypothetical protein